MFAPKHQHPEQIITKTSCDESFEIITECVEIITECSIKKSSKRSCQLNIYDRYSQSFKMDTMYIKDIRPDSKNINLTFIVLEVGHPVLLKENREVRTIKVADATACINMSIWDEPGKLLSPGDIVRLTKGYAGVWRNCLTLYSGKSGDLEKIGDFCMVFNEQVNMSEPNVNYIQNQQPTVSQNNGNGGRRQIVVDRDRPGPMPAAQPSGGKNASNRFSNDLPPSSGNKQTSKPSQRGSRGAPKSNVRSDRR